MTRALTLLLLIISLAPFAHANRNAGENSDVATRLRLNNSALARADKLLAELARLDVDHRVDLSTAAHPYERSLCARLSPRDAVTLLVGKPRRHAEWARASVADQRDGRPNPARLSLVKRAGFGAEK